MKLTRLLLTIALLALLILASAGLPSHAGAQAGPYTVRSGDTWSSVAARFGVSTCALAAANYWTPCSSIYNSGGLQVGQTLTIPHGPAPLVRPRCMVASSGRVYCPPFWR